MRKKHYIIASLYESDIQFGMFKVLATNVCKNEIFVHGLFEIGTRMMSLKLHVFQVFAAWLELAE